MGLRAYHCHDKTPEMSGLKGWRADFFLSGSKILVHDYLFLSVLGPDWHRASRQNDMVCLFIWLLGKQEEGEEGGGERQIIIQIFSWKTFPPPTRITPLKVSNRASSWQMVSSNVFDGHLTSIWGWLKVGMTVCFCLRLEAQIIM